MKIMKLQIDYLITNSRVYYPCAKGQEILDPSRSRNSTSTLDECTIKHIGRQIYLIGYFDWDKQGYGSGRQNPINQYILVFPSNIKKNSV